jgi:HAMP domain-containing protein
MERPLRPARRRTLPRIALPARLLISYLVVLATAAAPTFLYVRSELQTDLLHLAEERLQEGTRRAASGLMPFQERELFDRTRQISSVLPQRVTLIAPSGEVLFDSDSLNRENHIQRFEVRDALSSRPLLDISVSRRVSTSTGKETLYAATRLVEGGPVLRLADRVDDVVSAADDLTIFARNVAAVAITLAIVLSLLSAILFVRPLQRVVQAARRLAAGDLTASAGVVADDEVGDASRALDQMAVDLRRRLANAGSGDAVLAQLVDALPVPCVIIEPNGEPLTLNGPARRALRIEGGSARSRIMAIAGSGRFKRAVVEAEADGDPEPCVLIADDGFRFEGIVHVLKRPGAAPLTVLLGADPVADADVGVLPSGDVVVRAFADVLNEARARSHAVLVEHKVVLELDDEPGVSVADVEGRLARAMAIVFEWVALSASGRVDVVGVDVHVEPTRVRMAFDAVPDDGVVEAVKPLIGSLGGDITLDDTEVRLWLPRA